MSPGFHFFSWVFRLAPPDQLILKRSELAHAGFEDYDALCEGELVGRIYFTGDTSPRARGWFLGSRLRLPRGPHSYVWARADARSRNGGVHQELAA